MELDFLFKS